MLAALTRVLLVEDNPADVLLLQEALRDVPNHGLLLSPVATLNEALKSLDSKSFDAALLDLSLPDAEGLDIVNSTVSKAPELPIVVLTGRDDSELAVTAVRQGAQDYLVKGQVEGQLLVRSVRYAIERRKSLEAIERSERKFRHLIEKASDLIAVIGPDWNLRFVSPSVSRICGYRPEALEGRSFLDLLHQDDIEGLRKKGASAHDSDAPMELRVRHSTKGWRVLEASIRSFGDIPGGEGLVINAHDITARMQAEQQLRDVNQRLKALIDNSPLAIIQLDFNGTVISWNMGATRIFGWPEQETIGRMMPYVDEQVLPQFRATLEKARQGATVARLEIRRKRQNGSTADLHLWTSVLRNHSGEPDSVMAVLADVTEQKQLEEQYRHAQKMEAVGRLAGGVAHDFNNLLTVITGYAQLAVRRISGDDPGYSELQEVLAASERAAGLTKQLLALSRKQVVQPTLLDLNELLRGTARMLRRLVGDSVELRIECAPALSRVIADRAQIELVLLNLSANARDAMPEGGSLQVSTLMLPDGRVAMRVSDTGAGMTPETAARAFEPFFTTKEEGKGTGLGLSMSYTIVKQHGGDITIRSAVGKGTEIEIRLPAANEGAGSATQPSKAPGELRGSETILLAEDDRGVDCIVRETLMKLGYAILSASSGPEAISCARNNPGRIDLIVGDLSLMNSGSRTLLRELAAYCPGTPALLLCSSGSEQRLAADHGAPVAFLAKPFAPDALAANVRQVLNRSMRKGKGA